MQQPRRKPGRPGREPVEGERVGLSLRVTPETKRALDISAEAAGRSLSQEAELRLERSFREEKLLPQLLDLAYGQETAGLLMLLGEFIETATAHLGYFSIDELEPGQGGWIGRAWTYGQVKSGIYEILDALAPVCDEAMTPEASAAIARLERFGYSGPTYAWILLNRLTGPAGTIDPELNPVRERLARALSQRRRDKNAG